VPERLGPFLITGVLGTGGSAVVYAAVHNGQPVALKVPHDELSPKQQQRFLQEAGMLARVRHPAIVEVLDAGRLPDDRPYLAMRRHEGETLAAYLERHGALDLRHALRLFDELADAAAVLHDEDLVHRDIKPENVLLVEGAEHVVLLDLGIAKDLDAPASTTTQAGIAKGTPAVMAPERFFGAAASTRTDVYELAVVLYVMLVGRSPWSDSADAAARLNPAVHAARSETVERARACGVRARGGHDHGGRPAACDDGDCLRSCFAKGRRDELGSRAGARQA
jgi:serine/threonine-protein kinase